MNMKWTVSFIGLMVCLVVKSAWAEEIPVSSKIESIGLFKNGLASVRRTVELPKAGLYRLESTPDPVHGTFWIESPTPIAARTTWREVDSPVRNSVNIDFQQELVGKSVTIHFREGSIPPVTGKIIEIARQEDPQWNQMEEYRRGNIQPQGRFLIVETSIGRIYADSSMVAYVAVEGAADTVKRRAPVLLLNHEGEADKPTTVTISYLTRGIAWAPSYRINLGDSKKLSLEQQAVVKNELEDFSDAELQLISGFPSVQFGHVLSPISLDTTWANFFSQLNQRMSPQSALMSNVMQQAVIQRHPSEQNIDLSAIPTGEGVDLHYQSIGKRTMAVGDALSLSIAKAEADYERIVEWIVPDTRDASGRYIDERRRDEEPDKFQDAAWDAVRFKNPLPFAMTTAPAMISADGKFNGQRMSYWVNAGEQTTLQVTKALSLRTRAVEQEQQGEERDMVWIGGRPFRKIAVKGELSASNHRQEPIKLIIRRQFSGELSEADGKPQTILREEGVYSVNRRNELTWTLELPSGQAQSFNYSYTALVAH